MKIQFAYRVTGEKKEDVIDYLTKARAVLERRGYEVYVPILDPNQSKDKKRVILETLAKIRETDAILALVKSEEKSEGMLMEVGHALGLEKRLILTVKTGVDSRLRALADCTIEFVDDDDLLKKLGECRI